MKSITAILMAYLLLFQNCYADHELSPYEKEQRTEQGYQNEESQDDSSYNEMNYENDLAYYRELLRAIDELESNTSVLSINIYNKESMDTYLRSKAGLIDTVSDEQFSDLVSYINNETQHDSFEDTAEWMVRWAMLVGITCLSATASHKQFKLKWIMVSLMIVAMTVYGSYKLLIGPHEKTPRYRMNLEIYSAIRLKINREITRIEKDQFDFDNQYE